MISKHLVSRDPAVYQAWPDVALAADGRLVCVFSECTHHHDRSYTRIVVVDSADRGRTWSAKRPLTEGTAGRPYYYNCARITALRDGRLCVIVDRLPAGGEGDKAVHAVNLLCFSQDGGRTWGAWQETPLHGIVPDKLLELADGRWLISAHHPEGGFLAQFLHISTDQGRTWGGRITVASQAGLNLCEVSILPVDGGRTLVAFLRENSWQGWDCKKTLSTDGGLTWGPVIDFPLPACHRPVAGHLRDGRVLITHRFMPGGKGWLGTWTQNLFAALSDDASALATERSQAWARILPIDFDRSPKSDTGYSGWVEFPDGGLYIVNYIVDDAGDRAQIRGYSLGLDDFLLPDA